ncbi:clathrin light chain 2-like [Andrographis paniculata]|uniref:clathrin light chain 2-like n=1 Tax=Andrographis paniculata TaxID=175694 RepID=UPI0021E80875|nr:clathrin light chain 2-like [Andrographis paniculata]
MSSSFADSFDHFGGGGGGGGGGDDRSFDEGYLGSDSFSNFNSAAADSPPPIYASSGEFHSDSAFFQSETNTNGPILPEMGPEEGHALREWRRQNATRLEEKEKREKELLEQIVTEAEEYKVEFHKKRQLACETNRTANREKEKVFIASQEKFHAEADKDYWKSIAELIPKEIPTVDKRKGKKEQEKKPGVTVVQGPKPGKPTDLARMRQILIKLKHNTPAHLNQHSPPAPDAKTDASTPQKAAPIAVASTEAIAVS